MSYVSKGGYLLGAIAMLALTSTAEGRLASNRLASNRLAANKLASNGLAGNRLAANTLPANKPSSAGALARAVAGDGAFSDVSVIEFPNGLRLVR
jgi:hypothetical protein